MRLHECLMKAVEEAELTSAELARRSGVHKSTISALLRGESSGNVDTWSALMEACNVEIGYRRRDG